MRTINFVKTLKNLLMGKSMREFSSLYHSEYPWTWPLRPAIPRVNIKCYLCGFPRTGTHWIRNVIEKSTGTKTYDLYSNKPKADEKDISLVKIHARNRFMARLKAYLVLPPHNFGRKYIYTYRDPRDAILSLFEMYKKDKNYSEMSSDDFIKLYDPIRQYMWEINAWVLREHPSVMLVKFEDLKANPVKIFQDIFTFVEIKGEVHPGIIGEKVAVMDNKSRLRGVAFGWKNAPAEYKPLIDAISRQLHHQIKLLRYDSA